MFNKSIMFDFQSVMLLFSLIFLTGISSEIEAAVIFLIILLVISVMLVGIYYALKKDLCCCAIQKKESDQENVIDDEAEEEKWGEQENGTVDKVDEIGKESGNEQVEMGANEEIKVANETLTSEPSFTQSSFSPVADKPPKHSSAFKSVLKKISKPIGKVRFGGVSSKPAEDVPLVLPDDHVYGSMKRSDSMESFLSGVSVVSENIEEFGGEVSPGRLQTTLQYDKRSWTLYVGVKQADCLLHTGKEKIYWQVHVTFLPFKKHRFKTKYKSTSTPIFNQTFEVEEIAEQALSQIAIRFRVYGRLGKTGRKKLAGETLTNLDFMQGNDKKVTDWRILKRKASGPVVA